jgi:MFS family permease
LNHFKRDSRFWYVAFQLGIVGFFMGGFGPAQPLLQSNQGTSGFVAGLHGTALGLSGILAGILNAKMVHRWGRIKTSWFGMVVFLVGVLGFILLQPAALTITSTLLVGFGVTVLINNSVTYLSHIHPEHSTTAISQSNGFNSTMYVIGTLFIGTLATLGFGWRFGLLLTIPAALATYIYAKRVHAREFVDSEPESVGPQSGSLTGKYWLAWIGFTFAISAEFSSVFWAAALFIEKFNLSAGSATTLVLAFPLGMAVGRWFGPVIARTIDVDQRTFIFLAIQFTGFVVFWAADSQFVSVAGLFTTGLGASIQFALFSARLLRFAPDKPDLAIGKSALGAGLAIAFAPFALGALSDQIGISSAYLIIPVFILLATISVFVRSDQRVLVNPSQ